MTEFSTKCVNISTTVLLYLSFYALGLCTAMPGPTLLDLQQIVRTDTSKVAYIYLARSSGYLAGSLFGGILFDMLKKQELLLIVCNLIMALGALAIPWSRNVEALLSILAISGLCMGALDTGGNVFCLNIWGKDSAPYYQALHFSFGLGAFCAPLIAAPFLSNQDPESYSSYNGTLNESVISNLTMTSITNFTVNLNESNVPDIHNSVPLVTYAYTIIGVYTVFVTLLFAVVSFLCPQRKSCKSKNDTDNLSKDNILFTVTVIILAQVLLSVYCGIEIGYGQMLASFAVKGNLKLSKSLGSFLTAVFWGTFTFARGISVFLASKFTPFTLIFSDLVIMIFGSSILLAFSNTNVESLWMGTVLLAIGLSSFYPTVISWIERYVNITNKIASLFVIGASLGEMIIPLVVSQYIDSFPYILMYIVLGCTISGCVLTFLLWFVMSRKGEKYSDSIRTNNHKECESSL